MYLKESGWKSVDSALKDKIYDFSEGYKAFLDKGKTERLACSEALRMAEANGFVNLEEKESLSAGDKVYLVNRGKNLFLAVIGQEDVEKGISFVISHIDSPRIDLKMNPVYCDSGLALFKTHYYGGIKKYQWTTIPLAIHGVVVKANGETVQISVGDEPGDPVLYISDLLIHLAADQMQKKANEVVTGEALNILAGSLPDPDSEKDAEKEALLKLLNEKYGICEEDFLSAELEVVPAYPAKDVGFDRSMIGAYGHDDRVCAYTSMMGMFHVTNPAKTMVCFLADKEEVGSMGNTGMQSAFFEYAVATLIEKATGDYNELKLKRTFRNSRCLSSDVNAGADPTYPEVLEKMNASYMGRGVVLTKYTGARGKSSTSDASAEFMGFVRKCFDDAGVYWQSGELGKVDCGGGGTVAQYVANLDVEVVDCGVPLLSMHAPYEVASKFDVYMAYQAYIAFYSCR